MPGADQSAVRVNAAIAEVGAKVSASATDREQFSVGVPDRVPADSGYLPWR
jgi:hypothetical protein